MASTDQAGSANGPDCGVEPLGRGRAISADPRRHCSSGRTHASTCPFRTTSRRSGGVSLLVCINFPLGLYQAERLAAVRHLVPSTFASRHG